MNVLGEISKIQFGLYDKPGDAGNTAYLQAKHFDEYGRKILPIDTFLNIDTKNEGHLLNEGDIILAGKGFRNFAWTYRDNMGPAIASSMFFVIKPYINVVLPEFLTTLFNSTQTQAYFQTLGAGSSIPSIRKSELEALPINLPSLEVQYKIVKIKELHDIDIALTNKIIEEKNKRFNSIVNALIFNY
ncbi:MAG: restriction endonuclease subunit S [Cytophagaceae bacterium]